MPRQLDASFVTEVVILLVWAATTWYVYFTFKESGHAKGKTIALTLIVLAWSIFAFGAVKYGFDREFFLGLPIRSPVYLFLAAGLGYAFRWALVGKGLSQHMLIGLQLFRAIGWVFVLEHWRGNLPGGFGNSTVIITSSYLRGRTGRPVTSGLRRRSRSKSTIGLNNARSGTE